MSETSREAASERGFNRAINRLLNALDVARQELASQTDADNMLSATRSTFRRRRRTRRMAETQALADKTTGLWRVKLFLLSKAEEVILPPHHERCELSKKGLGIPSHDLPEGFSLRNYAQLSWSLQEFKNYVCQCFPAVSLNLIGFHFARADKSKVLKKIQVDTVHELRAAVGRSRVYIVPQTDITLPLEISQTERNRNPSERLPPAGPETVSQSPSAFSPSTQPMATPTAPQTAVRPAVSPTAPPAIPTDPSQSSAPPANGPEVSPTDPPSVYADPSRSPAPPAMSPPLPANRPSLSPTDPPCAFANPPQTAAPPAIVPPSPADRLAASPTPSIYARSSQSPAPPAIGPAVLATGPSPVFTDLSRSSAPPALIAPSPADRLAASPTPSIYARPSQSPAVLATGPSPVYADPSRSSAPPAIIARSTANRLTASPTATPSIYARSSQSPAVLATGPSPVYADPSRSSAPPAIIPPSPVNMPTASHAVLPSIYARPSQSPAPPAIRPAVLATGPSPVYADPSRSSAPPAIIAPSTANRLTASPTATPSIYARSSRSPPSAITPTPLDLTPLASSTVLQLTPPTITVPMTTPSSPFNNNSPSSSRSPSMSIFSVVNIDGSSPRTDLNSAREAGLDSARWLNAGTPEVFYRRSRVEQMNRTSVEDFYIDDSDDGEENDIIVVPFQSDDFPSEEEDLATILTNFQDHLSDDQVSTICVRRKKLLESAIKAISRASFCWTYSPRIEFVGEDADDLGGPQREFFRLLMIEVQTTLGIFEGKGGQVFLSYDQAALDQRKYFKGGNLIAWSVAHGGPCVKALDPTLFQLMCGQEPPLEQFDYRVLPDPDVQSKVQRILQCKSVGDLTALRQDLGDWIAECGVPGIFSATVEDMPKIYAYVVKHYMFL
ncbi:G2/M phase-specific E3 ubiquitin-protein ligase-like isoform X1, partial [Clarias magur]